MRFVLFTVLCISGFLFVHSSSLEHLKGNADAFFDSILEAVKKEHGKKLDPFKLPDQKASFSKPVGKANVNGDCKLWEGELFGLSSLHRSGDSNLGSDNGSMVADVRAGVDNCYFRYNAGVRFLKLHKNGVISGSFKKIDLRVKAKMGNQIEIKDLKLVELKDLKLKIEGLGILNPVANAVTNAFLKIFKPVVHNMLEKQLKKVLQEEAKKIKM